MSSWDLIPARVLGSFDLNPLSEWPFELQDTAGDLFCTLLQP